MTTGMTPPCFPPQWNDDLTAEILIRIGPHDPARLFQASVVCKLWHCILSDPGFCRRYRIFHRHAAPLLGFFCNLDFPCRFSSIDFPSPAVSSRFVATTSAGSALREAAAAHDDDDNRCVSWSSALDCRHGLVLFEKAGSLGFVVWDPITDDWSLVPPPSIRYESYAAVVLCGVAGCDDDHRDHDCSHGGSFLVVCVGIHGSAVHACVYSSEDRAWRAPVSDRASIIWVFDMKRRPAVIGDGIYCTFGVINGEHILKYDLVQRSFSLIGIPDNMDANGRHPLLMQNEDGSLGLAGVRGSRLYVWSRRWNTHNIPEEEEGDAAGWVQRRVIKLRKLLPLDINHCVKAYLIGFAEGDGVFFIRTNAGVFTLELKSRRAVKVSNPSKIYSSVVPFISFFTPGGMSSLKSS